MLDFNFDAPRKVNLNRQFKIKTQLQINLNDPNDQWFMIQHVELTPLKQNRKPRKSRSKSSKSRHIEIAIDDKKQAPKDKQESKQKMLKNTKKSDNISKASLRPEKLKRFIFRQQKPSEKHVSVQISKEENVKYARKYVQAKKSSSREIKLGEKALSKTKSDASIRENKKVKMPCPMSLRIQRDWESRSQRSWYNLTQKSAERALNSMKKIIPKNTKNQKKRFKF